MTGDRLAYPYSGEMLIVTILYGSIDFCEVYRSIQIQESCVEVVRAAGLLSQAALSEITELSPSSLCLLNTIFTFTRLTISCFTTSY